VIADALVAIGTSDAFAAAKKWKRRTYPEKLKMDFLFLTLALLVIVIYLPAILFDKIDNILKLIRGK
jgi:hypothetical protein